MVLRLNNYLLILIIVFDILIPGFAIFLFLNIQKAYSLNVIT